MTKMKYKLSITGYGELEVKSLRDCRKLDKILDQNPCLGPPTHKIPVVIKGFIADTRVANHDGVGEPYGLEVTEACIQL